MCWCTHACQQEFNDWFEFKHKKTLVEFDIRPPAEILATMGDVCRIDHQDGEYACGVSIGGPVCGSHIACESKTVSRDEIGLFCPRPCKEKKNRLHRDPSSFLCFWFLLSNTKTKTGKDYVTLITEYARQQAEVDQDAEHGDGASYAAAGGGGGHMETDDGQAKHESEEGSPKKAPSREKHGAERSPRKSGSRARDKDRERAASVDERDAVDNASERGASVHADDEVQYHEEDLDVGSDDGGKAARKRSRTRSKSRSPSRAGSRSRSLSRSLSRSKSRSKSRSRSSARKRSRSRSPAPKRDAPRGSEQHDRDRGRDRGPERRPYPDQERPFGGDRRRDGQRFNDGPLPPRRPDTRFNAPPRGHGDDGSPAWRKFQSVC